MPPNVLERAGLFHNQNEVMIICSPPANILTEKLQRNIPTKTQSSTVYYAKVCVSKCKSQSLIFLGILLARALH